MDTVTKIKRTVRREDTPLIPPLQTGDHLTLVEFERRYSAQPHLKKAELIEGVVYVPSPVHLDSHARPHSRIMGLLFNYMAATPGTDTADNASVRLDAENEVQPDAMLRIREEYGGQSRQSEDDYLIGAPELIVEIAASSAAYDLHEKLRVYRRTGVKEYVVLLTLELGTVWYRLNEGRYDVVSPDEDGIYRSTVFPGLHFHSANFWADDVAGQLAVLQAGIATPAHADFVAALRPV